MRYFPLIWAALWRKPTRTIFDFFWGIVALAACLCCFAGTLRADEKPIPTLPSSRCTPPPEF